jgi:uncharacterized membrane protein
MSKFRLESLSDNVISIIMTLMAFNIGSSLSYQPLDEIQLWSELSQYLPYFCGLFC